MELPEAAHSLFLMFDAYVQEGFTREEALQLVIGIVNGAQ